MSEPAATPYFERLEFPELAADMSAGEICALTRTRLQTIISGDRESKELQIERRQILAECGAWVAAHNPAVVDLVGKDGCWTIPTPQLLEWMGLMAMRNWLGDIIDGQESNLRAAKSFDKMTDFITGANAARGWCRHVALTESRSGMRRVGTYCGRDTKEGGVTCGARRQRLRTFPGGEYY